MGRLSAAAAPYHIWGDYPKTLCGRLERAVMMISHEGEIGVARDICRSCARLHARSAWEFAEAARRAQASELLMVNADRILATPCCGGSCGRL
jgi:hypothetical protein